MAGHTHYRQINFIAEILEDGSNNKTDAVCVKFAEGGQKLLPSILLYIRVYFSPFNGYGC